MTLQSSVFLEMLYLQYYNIKSSARPHLDCGDILYDI